VAAILSGLPRQSALDIRNACILELLYSCGLRRCEAIGLDVNHVNLTENTVWIEDSKHGQNRLLPLMGTAATAVRDWLALRRTLVRGPDRGALFLTRDGKRLTVQALAALFGGLNERRGIEARHLHCHLFRHSIAVHLLRGGADVRHVQAFLGHASLDTTKIYLRMVPGRLKEEYEKAMPEIAVGAGP
jgi:site-specific recombinase XerD